MSSWVMKSAGYYDLRQALSEPGCALCRLLAKVADNYLDGVLWEPVNDANIRRELNQARGYCQDHAWLLVRYGASLGRSPAHGRCYRDPAGGDRNRKL